MGCVLGLFERPLGLPFLGGGLVHCQNARLGALVVWRRRGQRKHLL